MGSFKENQKCDGNGVVNGEKKILMEKIKWGQKESY